MRKWLLVVVVALFALTYPALAQQVLDPDADLTETITFGRYSVRYIEGMTTEIAESAQQIKLDFSNTDYISIALPPSFELYGIANDDIVTAANAVYDLFSGMIDDDDRLELLEEIELGDGEAYFFMGTSRGMALLVYIFAVSDEIFAATLNTDASETALEIQQTLTERILASITVGDADTITADATPDPSASLLDERLAPLDAIAEIELTQAVRNELIQVVTLQLPADWVYDATAILIFSNSQNALDQTKTAIPDLGDNIVLQVLVGIDESFDDVLQTIETLDNITALVTYTNLDVRLMVVVTPGEIEEVEDVEGLEFIYVLVELADTGEVAALFGIGNYDAYEAEILAIILSARYEE